MMTKQKSLFYLPMEIDGKKQDGFHPHAIVLGPGGVKGFLQLGALFALERVKMLDRVKSYTGVSVGAIISLLLCSGCEIKEIIQYAIETDLFRNLNHFSFEDMKTGTGFISNDSIKSKLMDVILSKFGYIPSMTIFHNITGYDFCAVAYNITRNETEYISYHNYPDISIIDATMLSMNIPILFFKAIYNGNTYVDGALGDPYPVGYHDKKEKELVLGVYVDNVCKEESVQSYANSIIMAPMRELRKMKIHASSQRCKHLGIHTDIVNITGLNLSLQNKAEMVVEGFKQAGNFLINNQVIARR